MTQSYAALTLLEERDLLAARAVTSTRRDETGYGSVTSLLRQLFSVRPAGRSTQARTMVSKIIQPYGRGRSGEATAAAAQDGEVFQMRDGIRWG